MNEPVFLRPFLNRDRLIQIVDPDLQTCETLSVLFRIEGFQTGFSVDRQNFLAALDRKRPDVVLLNFELDEADNFGLLRGIKKLRTGIPVIMMENVPRVDAAVAAMKVGASDVFTKPIDSEGLVAAVREILRQDIHAGAVQAGGRAIEVRGFAQLTGREREVLQILINGRTNKEAGRELGVSPRTIEVHRAHVMQKLGARNTAELMKIVLTS